MKVQEVQRRSGRRATPGTAVLVAADASMEGHECVLGELVWTSDLCGDRPCRCEWGYNGVASGGVTTVAEVRRLEGVDRAAVRRAIQARMVSSGYPTQIAADRVDALLRVASGLPEGTLLRLDRGRPVPFPPGSRLVGRGRVVIPSGGRPW